MPNEPKRTTVASGICSIKTKDSFNIPTRSRNQEGNPYNFVGNDYNGNIGLEFSILGLPETILTNEQGKIIFKHMGPLTKDTVTNNIIPFL